MASTFDWNEIFFLASTLVSVTIAYLLPRRFHPYATFSLWIFVVIFIETIDYTLGVRPYDFYHFLDGPGYQITVGIAHFFLYPSAAYIFIYFYDKWQLRGKRLALYITGWTVVSVFYEWLCVVNEVLTYIHWNLLLSIPTYPVACLITITVFHFIKRNFSLHW
ncbi:hypothetical protein CIB95_11465 [Lottiidibacillus patelloidae]|uniref:Uncharacterized protein n=1 Tax=Lottiidibacillus patelloidae TaxID=2670334 RepID=A0A263BSP3_9BACI|nr:hypothetical protein [Lottiidibacillus patelloidae]OZM56387.1 hypothetical protein CIB95_11465 [Lottiidibacillus patelloidae]